MSDLTAAPAVRLAIPAQIASWPQAQLWRLSVDLYPALAAASLPWSTTAVSVFMVLWLIVLLPTIRWPAFFEALRAPASYLPLAFFALALAGLLWTRESWPAGIQGILPVVKLLAVPLLLYHFERSERGHWVLLAFLAACALLMGVSWVTYFADWKMQPGGMAGVPVRNYIDQSHEFALCLFVMAPLLLSLAAKGNRAWTLAFAAVMVGFYLDMRFVASSRTALVYFPILLILFAVKYLNRRRAICFLLLAAAVECAVLLSSPYLRDRVVRTVEDYKVDRETRAVRDANAAAATTTTTTTTTVATTTAATATATTTATATSNGLRLAYWRVSLRAMSEAPVLGHGTGSTQQLFRSEAEGKSGEWANIVRNPHNQTLYVAIQWGVLGCLVLYAMWYFHLKLFLGTGFASWVGLVVVVQNFISSLLNSHLFDFHEGWVYVLGVGVAGGMAARARRPADSAQARKSLRDPARGGSSGAAIAVQ
ncbi:O-antigen ligase family protein [Bradyrhizobium roseum]|uniref:O-antigen ligase family protein n=1 Tax=Bradyrhizobium roseum TaxID=3056648 RepID=UPI0026330330|nr:O-antigen ligase family protein [Bradyrhizobium roseus]WKA25731.1 O-antigen ligase family protein [Bradyrhizobium roseus]